MHYLKVASERSLVPLVSTCAVKGQINGRLAPLEGADPIKTAPLGVQAAGDSDGRRE